MTSKCFDSGYPVNMFSCFRKKKKKLKGPPPLDKNQQSPKQDGHNQVYNLYYFSSHLN